MKLNKSLIYSIVLTLLLSGCAATTPEPPPTSTPIPEPTIPDEIIIEKKDLFPEGIEYDEIGERFLVSSVTEGTIFQVADDGTIEPFIEDDDLQMTLGIEIDHNNNLLLVANNSHSEDNAMLGSYNLVTGQRIFMANLNGLYSGASPLANDVAVDTNGIAYVTDSNNPVIYKVDMDGKASIFIENSILDSINGIVAHPDGFLILGQLDGYLLKIPLDSPEIIKIDIPEGYLGFYNTDGMLLHPDGSLIMVTFPDSKIGRLSSDDNWQSASHVSSSLAHTQGYGTTIALRGESVYVIYSHLNRWSNGTSQGKFEIVQAEFK